MQIFKKGLRNFQMCFPCYCAHVTPPIEAGLNISFVRGIFQLAKHINVRTY